MENETVLRLRSALTMHNVSRASIARAAGLHPNTLADCEKDDWNPTLNTLNAIRAELDRMEALLGSS